MTESRFVRKSLIISLGLVILLTVLSPLAALAQEVPSVPFPATYRGIVVDANGQPVPTGTQVYAIVDGWKSDVAQVGVPSDIGAGKYWLPVRPPSTAYFGKTVTFYVGDKLANQTAIFPNVNDPAADRFPTVNLTVPYVFTPGGGTPVIPPELGDSATYYIMLASALGGLVLLAGGIYVLSRRSRPLSG